MGASGLVEALTTEETLGFTLEAYYTATGNHGVLRRALKKPKSGKSAFYTAYKRCTCQLWRGSFEQTQTGLAGGSSYSVRLAIN